MFLILAFCMSTIELELIACDNDGIQVWKITNDLVMQVRDLSTKVTLLEEEKEKSSDNTEKLINIKAVKEKSTALEEKKKE